MLEIHKAKIPKGMPKAKGEPKRPAEKRASGTTIIKNIKRTDITHTTNLIKDCTELVLEVEIIIL